MEVAQKKDDILKMKYAMKTKTNLLNFISGFSKANKNIVKIAQLNHLGVVEGLSKTGMYKSVRQKNIAAKIIFGFT